MKRSAPPLILLLSLFTHSLVGAPDKEWLLHKTENNAHPSDHEQQMFWLQNRARTNPIEEGKWLVGDILTLPPAVTQEFNFRGISKELVRDEFAAIPPKPPSAFDRRLYEASKAHSEFMIAENRQTHDGQFAKVDASGFVKNGGAISVFWRAQDGVHGHAVLNIDWGGGTPDGLQTGRGHRRSIHADNGLWTNVGLAMVENSTGSAGPLVTSIAYYRASNFAADHYNRFIVGTIWTDTNGNSQYDPGEGHAGVTIMPDTGEFWATTADSGGFAIPATEAGTYNLTISGGDLAEAQQRTVQVAENNVLMIWNEVDKWPDPPVAEAPLLQVATNGDLMFSFPVKDGQSYQLRNTTDFENFFNDNRPFSMNGDSYSFEVSQGDIDTGTFFDILVTVD